MFDNCIANNRSSLGLAGVYEMQAKLLDALDVATLTPVYFDRCAIDIRGSLGAEKDHKSCNFLRGAIAANGYTSAIVSNYLLDG